MTNEHLLNRFVCTNGIEIFSLPASMSFKAQSRYWLSMWAPRKVFEAHHARRRQKQKDTQKLRKALADKIAAREGAQL